VGQRVIAGAITPCGQCFYCLNSAHSQCGGPLGGWRFGNTIDGAWAEYLRVPDARANLAVIPDQLTDEDVVLVPDIRWTSSRTATSHRDSVAVLRRVRSACATIRQAARRRSDHRHRLDSRPARWRAGANVVINHREQDCVASSIATDGRVDVAIEALGRQETFENALRAIRPGGTLSSLGVYSGKIVAPYEALYAGLGDQKIVTTLCPGGKERMRRLMAMIAARRVDLSPLITHHFAFDDIQEAYELFAAQRDGVMKVALHPTMTDTSRQLAMASVDDQC
jgi:threonine dehydrogenase-like Zn-dependent dehydrogenase